LEAGQEKNQEMNYSVFYTRKAIEEDIPFLDKAVAERVRMAIEQKLMLDPIRFGKPLQYDLAGARSLRVGDYRIIYEVDRKAHSILIRAVGHRSGIYEQ
jgi:mRNA interferase RelE/StbE